MGWASLEPYSHRCAYDGVADLSVYVDRAARGSGIGSALLGRIVARARAAEFQKIVPFALVENVAGVALYRKMGFREVGIFERARAARRPPRRRRRDGAAAEAARSIRLQAQYRDEARWPKHSCGVWSGTPWTSRRPVRSPRIVRIPGVVAAMAEVDMDIASARPKLLDPALVARAYRIITMGCDVAGVPRIDDDWGLPIPKASLQNASVRFATSFVEKLKTSQKNS